MDNPTLLGQELATRFARIDGFADFMRSLSLLAGLTSTNGWQDPSGTKLYPNAKPIGLRQWGEAQIMAGIITEAVPGAPWPEPGADTDDCGYILMQWKISHNAQLDLTLRGSLVQKTYQWTQMRDGIRSEARSSNDYRDVIASLRATMVGAPKRLV
jgi:hypothetical protein